MRYTRIASFTAAAAIVMGAAAGIAHAQTSQTHVLTVRLPDGRIEQIRYLGDVPPVVVLGPAAGPAAFDPIVPFAMMDWMANAMDRETEGMIRTIDAMTASAAPGFAAIPAMSGPNVCMRSVRITYAGNGQAPQIVSHTSGDCGPASGPSTPAELPAAPAAQPAPRVIEAKAAIPYQGLVHPVGDWQR